MTTDEVTKPDAVGNPALAIVVGLAAWLVPGLGHLLLRKWGKALAYFLAVSALALVGLLARGNVFVNVGDPLDRLGFLADLGTGIFYFLSHSIAPSSDLAHAAGDYGTRLIASAGVLNLLCVLESVYLALGRYTLREIA